MSNYHITATQNGQTKYYCAFDLMVNPPVLITTTRLESANKFRTLEKAQEWHTWLEKRFPAYSYQIEENNQANTS